MERIILDAGHTAHRLTSDYGYDLVLVTYDEDGYVEPGFLPIQVKAAETLRKIGTNFVMDLDIRDFNLWMQEETPVILILYDASRRQAYWLDFQRHFEREDQQKPKKGARWVRVHVPRQQLVSRRAIERMRELKRKAPVRLFGGV